LIVTPHIAAARDFWMQKLGFDVGFAARWFVWLQSPDGSASIAFMTPDHPSKPPGAAIYAGEGICFEMQVEDAKAAEADFRAAGGVPEHPLTVEPFGQRRFGFRDPAGLWIDIVEQVEPEAGYWARYADPASS
jgi:catechol 2,3-dioxygenase-like lactoylglutathione lyase family enzyme